MNKLYIIIALFCSLATYAKDNRPINYQFHNNDTINLIRVEEEDGNKKTSKLQVIVLDAKNTKATLKFNTIAYDVTVDSAVNSKMKDYMPDKEQLLAKIQALSLPPIIKFENGKPKSIVNFNEVKASISAIFDETIDFSSKKTKALHDSQEEEADSTIFLFHFIS